MKRRTSRSRARLPTPSTGGLLRGLIGLSPLLSPGCVWWIDGKIPGDSHDAREDDDDSHADHADSVAPDSDSAQSGDSRDTNGELDTNGVLDTSDTTTTDSTVTGDTGSTDHSGGLYLELTWTVPNDDLDLHLLAPDGTLETNTDCYYMNCTTGSLDWGESGEDDDDPNMDLDDIPGTGPEITRIQRPEDGLFTVVVNDYPGSVYSDANLVNVDVYVRGILKLSCSFEVTGEDADVEVATIDYPTNVVTPLVSCE